MDGIASTIGLADEIQAYFVYPFSITIQKGLGTITKLDCFLIEENDTSRKTTNRRVSGQVEELEPVLKLVVRY